MKYQQRQRWKKRMFSMIAIVISVIMVLGLLSPVFAAEATVEQVQQEEETEREESLSQEVGAGQFEMDLEIGFGGSYVVERMTPVFGTVTNLGEPFYGELQVKAYTYENSDTGYQKYAIYAQKLELEEGAAKQVNMELGMNTIRKYLEVSLVDENGEVVYLENIPIQAISPEAVVVGVLSEQPSQVQYLSALSANQGTEKGAVFFLDSDSFPHSQEVMQNFRILVIDDYRTESLGDDQKAALQNWVDQGGTLVLGTGPQAEKVLSGLDFVEATVNASTSVSAITEWNGTAVALESPLTLAQISSEQAITVWNSQEGTALTSLLPYGSGSVLIHHFALGLTPFSHVSNAAQLLRSYYLQWIPDLFSTEGIDTSLPQLEYISAQFPVMTSSSMHMLFGVVAVYILLAGPGLYWLLKKKDKRERGWICIPLLSVAFMGVVFVMTGNSAYRDSLLNTVAMVELKEGSTTGEAVAAMTIKTPQRGDITFRTEDSLPIQPKIDRGWYNGNADTETLEYKIMTGADTEVVFYQTAAWSSNSLQAKASVDVGGSILSDVRLDGNTVIGTVTNQTNIHFVDAYIGIENLYLPIGELPAGGSVEVSEEIDADQWNQRYYDGITAAISGSTDSLRQQVNSGRLTMEEGYRLARESDLISQKEGEMMYGGMGWQDKQIISAFYGFSDMPLFQGNKYLNGKAMREVGLTMYYVDFVQELSKTESFDLPFCVYPEDTSNQIYNLSYDTWNNICEVWNMMSADQEIILTYRIGDGVKVEEIQFQTDANYINGLYAPTEIYNIRTAQWEVLSEEAYAAADYVDENNQVQLRLYLYGGEYAHTPAMRVKGGGLYA